MDAFQKWFSFKGDHHQSDLESQNSPLRSEHRTIEDYPPGYPRFSALIGSHNSLQLYRKFSALRSRDILLKQDRLSILEKRLNDIDKIEKSPSLLATSRRDNNAERQVVLSEIGKALIEYDETLIRNSNILSLEKARTRRYTALQNWIQGNPCIARNETEYLQHEEDLIDLSPRGDETMTTLIEWVEDKLLKIPGNVYKKKCQKLSRDLMVYLPDGNLTANLARMLVGSFVILLIITPVIICISLQGILSRLIVISIATTFFVASLSGGTQAKIVEIFAAGAAYATVLTIFITQGGPG